MLRNFRLFPSILLNSTSQTAKSAKTFLTVRQELLSLFFFVVNSGDLVLIYSKRLSKVHGLGSSGTFAMSFFGIIVDKIILSKGKETG